MLKDWKGDSYTFGRGVLPKLGALAAKHGKTALVVCNTTYMKPVADAVVAALEKAGVQLAGGRSPPMRAPTPPGPTSSAWRPTSSTTSPTASSPSAGSTIDACKAANFLAALGSANTPEIDPYFGTGQVSEALKKTGKKLTPLIAVQTSASSGAHLTKYSNITDPAIGQKKLVVDEAVIPRNACSTTTSPPRCPCRSPSTAPWTPSPTPSRCSPASRGQVRLAAKIAENAIELSVKYAPRVVKDPKDLEARRRSAWPPIWAATPSWSAAPTAPTSPASPWWT
jgi:alcohol dehydrogenase